MKRSNQLHFLPELSGDVTAEPLSLCPTLPRTQCRSLYSILFFFFFFNCFQVCLVCICMLRGHLIGGELGMEKKKKKKGWKAPGEGGKKSGREGGRRECCIKEKAKRRNEWTNKWITDGMWVSASRKISLSGYHGNERCKLALLPT